MTYSSDDIGAGADPFSHPLDAILADIAIALQLPPGLHAKACRRYEAVRDYAEREGSPLRGRVLQFYPQGSMSIDATTSTRGTDDEYDLDIIAALDVEPDAPPSEVLDLLFSSVKDYPTSQGIIRQTRCVTVRYADRMHLDITPAARLPGTQERESHIFHANPDEPAHHHCHVPMNAYGFADWYRGRTPQERQFGYAFDERLRKTFGLEILAEAEVDDVPAQIPLHLKSVTTVALQLLKRFRNVAYAASKGRIPPSVMLSCFAGRAGQPGLSLSSALIRQARLIAEELRRAGARHEKIIVLNPICTRDCFTDRWPENLSQQEEFAKQLTEVADGLEYFKQNETDLETLQSWLRDKFGPLVVSVAVNRFNERNGEAVKNGSVFYTKQGRLFVPSSPAIVGLGAAAPSARAVAATAHTFRGERR